MKLSSYGITNQGKVRHTNEDALFIDEAQDTNWAQWTIVQAMADEFFAGEGAGGDQAGRSVRDAAR